MSPRSLQPLFDPACVAVVGASDDPRKWGNWLGLGALRGEQRRPAYLVNHRAQLVLGRPAFRSLDQLPQAPELVVIAVPVALLEQTVDQALAVGARAIIAITGGSNGDGLKPGIDAQLAARVRAAGALLVGPNCLGVLDWSAQLEMVPGPLPAGEIGLISQSGNVGLEVGLLAEPEGLGFSRFVSLGNQADVDAAELIASFAAHEQTRVIALYIEDFRDGRELARAGAAAVAAGKPVIALAIEQGGATSRAVQSHTGALASDGAAIDAACSAAGIERVRTPHELLDLAKALLRYRPARGRRIAVLSDGGGHASIAAGLATAVGLELPELDGALPGSLRKQLPPGAAVANPVDLAGAAERDVHAFDKVAEQLLRSGQVDALLLTGYFGGYADYGPVMAAQEIDTAVELGAVAARCDGPLIVQTMYPRGPVAAALRGAGVPVYESVDAAVFALRRLAGARQAPAREVPQLPGAASPVQGDGYEAARELLRDAGIEFVAQRTVSGREEAAQAGRQIGYPVVLKALGSLHKSDRGGIVIGIAGEQALLAAHDRIAATRCSVEAMAPLSDGVELLIGCRWDARFGPIALCGSGGIYAELLADTAAALAPVSQRQALEMLRSLRIAPILEGARGRPPLDVAAAATALAALSDLAARHPELAELEINPLLVTSDRALALDARFVRATHER